MKRCSPVAIRDLRRNPRRLCHLFLRFHVHRLARREKAIYPISSGKLNCQLCFAGSGDGFLGFFHISVWRGDHENDGGENNGAGKEDSQG